MCATVIKIFEYITDMYEEMILSALLFYWVIWEIMIQCIQS